MPFFPSLLVEAGVRHILALNHVPGRTLIEFHSAALLNDSGLTAKDSERIAAFCLTGCIDSSLLLPVLTCCLTELATRRRSGGSSTNVTRRISMTTRKELVEALRGRYQEADTRDKVKTLDEFAALTGYHRKHAIRLLREETTSNEAPTRSRLYDEAVRQALTLLWEAADRGLRQAAQGHDSDAG